MKKKKKNTCSILISYLNKKKPKEWNLNVCVFFCVMELMRWWSWSISQFSQIWLLSKHGWKIIIKCLYIYIYFFFLFFGYLLEPCIEIWPPKKKIFWVFEKNHSNWRRFFIFYFYFKNFAIFAQKEIGWIGW